MLTNLLIPQSKIADFCQRHHIHKLALFGSILRDDFRPDSDVDVLVEFEEGYVPDFFRLYDMEQELSALFDRHPIDLVTFAALNRHLRKSVLSAAMVVYEQR